MKIKRSILAPTLVALIALATGGWFLQQGASQERNVYFQARLFEEVLHHVSDRFVEETKPSELYRMAIDGLLQELGDPHSVFMTPEDYNELRVQTQGEYGGLGIQIDIRDGWVTVISPLPGTPAERAGLQAGDRIVAVDGESTKGWTSNQAVKNLRGPKGSAVNLEVMRYGAEEPIPFKVVRDHIRIKSVPTAYVIEDGIGYINLAMFSETSTDEVRDAVNRLRGEGVKGIVLDLRSNPGGLLDQGVGVTDLFLDRGESVVETRSRIPSQNQVLSAVDQDQYPGLPIVVLVGRGTASAAEILAGALQDHDRALVIGETTFGKGSVQTLIPLSAGNFLKLTTARWYTPSGRSIQKPYGIDGDRAEMEEDTAAKVFRTDAGRPVKGGGGIHPDLIVHPDTLSTAEQEFIEAVQQHGSEFRNTVFNFAVEYTKDHPDLSPDFVVSQAMLDTFYRRLQEAGIEVDRALYDGAADWIGRDLAMEIAYAKWGQEAARRRANLEDRQVQVAVELLRNAANPQSLFAYASRYEEAHADVVGTATSEEDADGSQSH